MLNSCTVHTTGAVETHCSIINDAILAITPQTHYDKPSCLMHNLGGRPNPHRERAAALEADPNLMIRQLGYFQSNLNVRGHVAVFSGLDTVSAFLV
ncbi:hypothetical protein PG999_007636 [Apiospora kogelbergensis]|uniref:Uncharacterized protein n=1 Tax=Apiospora kogelbergensis TaxID=1337665 RepID=A0AAW0QNJ7_9PEZI